MHPKNRFWPVLGALTGENYAAMNFAARRAALTRHGIGLYDAVYECDIMLSSDAKAKNIVPADIPALIGGTRVQRIFCNGALSYATLVKFLPLNPWRKSCRPQAPPTLRIICRGSLRRGKKYANLYSRIDNILLNMHPMGAIFIISEYIRFGTTPLIIGRSGKQRRIRPLLLAVRQRGALP